MDQGQGTAIYNRSEEPHTELYIRLFFFSSLVLRRGPLVDLYYSPLLQRVAQEVKASTRTPPAASLRKIPIHAVIGASRVLARSAGPSLIRTPRRSSPALAASNVSRETCPELQRVTANGGAAVSAIPRDDPAKCAQVRIAG